MTPETDQSVWLYSAAVPRIAASDREERRRRFIDAAWRCAASRGFHDTTVDDVCAEAHASKGAFYVYFDSKRTLLLALIEEDAAVLDGLMATLERRNVTAVERLRRFTKAMLDRGAEQATVQVRTDLWTASLTDPVVARRAGELVAHRRSVLRGWVQQAVDDGELVLHAPANALASLLLALGDGLMLHGSLDATGFRWPNIARALDDIFAGLAP
jgi:AcrR family transcriptional regulator